MRHEMLIQIGRVVKPGGALSALVRLLAAVHEIVYLQRLLAPERFAALLAHVRSGRAVQHLVPVQFAA